MKEVIKISDISFKRLNKIILNNINFSIYENETVAIIGTNGSGKTTLIDIILDDIKPSTGKVYINDSKVKNYSTIGIAYDSLPLFPLLKVSEVIDYFCAILKLNYDAIKHEFFNSFDIDIISNSFIKDLSQGEKKKIGLLLAVMNNPKILILDEPFSNLDPTIVDVIWKVLTKNNRTILFTTHNWKEVEAIASKVMFLHNGILITTPKKPKEILKELPKKKITISFNNDFLHKIAEYEYYVHDDLINVLYNENDINVIKTISEHTNNFSIQDVDIKDAYLFKIKKHE